ncbi:hypothetical protein ACFFK0_28315 [Paenibacillus chartarius]|uniref:DUF2157 domain-containing protein n=1 Tax=Paenibacillus chartarius TaxID=747481 RepID=A0ABV6DUH2_9BACL
MDADKKVIVVKEIEQWRRSKLLPEQYCDFLLNLYADNADAGSSDRTVLGMSSSAIANSSWKGWLLALGVIGFTLIIGLNFNSFAISLQIGIAVLVLLCCYTFAYRFRAGNPLIPNALVGIGSLFLLVVGVYLLKLNQITEPSAYVGYIAGTSSVWLLTGLTGRMPIFHFSGWMGLIGCYAWVLNDKLGELAFVPLQLSWLPLCVLLIWSGWLLHQRAKRAGAILFLVGCLVWLVPEVYGFILPVDLPNQQLQALLIGKIAAAAAFLFLLRKKWIEWVA